MEDNNTPNAMRSMMVDSETGQVLGEFRAAEQYNIGLFFNVFQSENARAVKELSHTEYFLLLRLCAIAKKCMIIGSLDELAKETRFSRTRFYVNLKKLISLDYLRKVSTNIYMLSPFFSYQGVVSEHRKDVKTWNELAKRR